MIEQYRKTPAEFYFQHSMGSFSTITTTTFSKNVLYNKLERIDEKLDHLIDIQTKYATGWIRFFPHARKIVARIDAIIARWEEKYNAICELVDEYENIDLTKINFLSTELVDNSLEQLPDFSKLAH